LTDPTKKFSAYKFFEETKTEEKNELLTLIDRNMRQLETTTTARNKDQNKALCDILRNAQRLAQG